MTIEQLKAQAWDCMRQRDIWDQRLRETNAKIIEMESQHAYPIESSQPQAVMSPNEDKELNVDTLPTAE